ncbi:hypothetical protein ACFWPQ_36625 [Streptomyces sp. NPDC058464]|uniref:hypothetical protein n=1 Tax=Streptomyces sp. NPDC058464 TaxID=3346511 RepID=UPI00365AC868
MATSVTAPRYPGPLVAWMPSAKGPKPSTNRSSWILTWSGQDFRISSAISAAALNRPTRTPVDSRCLATSTESIRNIPETLRSVSTRPARSVGDMATSK